jgi:hypothetical protein
LDGKGACVGKAAYPNMEINKLFSENSDLWRTSGAYDWKAIKEAWHAAWAENEHYKTADPKVYLEKTPQGIFASDMYVEQFDNTRFIIMTRNPYAVAEGMRRTILADVSIERCIKHWIKCAQRQMYNYEKYKNIAIEITYEELVSAPRTVEQKIRQFIPALNDVDLTGEVAAHSLEGMKVKPLTDFNERHINNLSDKDIAIINKELEKVPGVLEHFGYDLEIERVSIRPFIPYDAYDWLASFVKPHHRIFEYGSGKSTLWFGKHAGEVVAVDRVPHCYETCARELEEHGINNVEYVLKADKNGGPDIAGYSKLIHEYEGQFDLVFVDGHFRKECIEECYEKARYAVFMDNTDAPHYQDAYNIMKSWSDGTIIDFYSYGLNPYTGKENFIAETPDILRKWKASVFLKENPDGPN